jgi:hypothetical protein
MGSRNSKNLVSINLTSILLSADLLGKEKPDNIRPEAQQNQSVEELKISFPIIATIFLFNIYLNPFPKFFKNI